MVKKTRMVKGLDNTKVKRNPWKTRMERDIILHKDLIEAYQQRGKVMGEIVKQVVGKTKKKKPKSKIRH